MSQKAAAPSSVNNGDSDYETQQEQQAADQDALHSSIRSDGSLGLLETQKDFPRADSFNMDTMEEQQPARLTPVESYDEDNERDDILRKLIRKASTASLQGLGSLSHRGTNGHADHKEERSDFLRKMQAYESLEFDPIESHLEMANRCHISASRHNYISRLRWIIAGLIGVAMGTVAFFCKLGNR